MRDVHSSDTFLSLEITPCATASTEEVSVIRRSKAAGKIRACAARDLLANAVSEHSQGTQIRILAP